MNKAFCKECQTKTLFRLKSDKPEDYRVLEIPYSQELKETLEHHHGDNLAEIINERFLPESSGN